MRLYIVAIILILMCANCSEIKCPPSTTTDKIVKQTLKDYFPYKPGDTIKFTRYYGALNVGVLVFTVDTTSFIERVSEYSDCGIDRVYKYENINHFCFKLSNQTKEVKDGDIEIIGKYAKDQYYKDQDPSELNIVFYGTRFSFDNFGDAVVHGDSTVTVDSIFFNNKNYGPGFCISSTYPYGATIYFNSTYGILKYIRQSTEQQLIYTE